LKKLPRYVISCNNCGKVLCYQASKSAVIFLGDFYNKKGEINSPFLFFKDALLH